MAYDPQQFRENPGRVVHVAKAETDGDGVENLIGVRQIQRVPDNENIMGMTVVANIDHCLRQIGGDNPRPGTRDRDRRGACAGSQIEDELARLRGESVKHGRAPMAILAQRCEIVQQIVSGCNSRKHLGDIVRVLV